MLASSASVERVTPATGSTPLVTVAVPVFNGARYLRECLDSHLAQTETDFELLVLDNASTDETPQIAQEYVRRDSRVRHIRHPKNIGAANNYNEAVRLARGRYFRWGAADDRVAPTSLARCLAILEADPDVAIAYPKTLLIDADGQPIRAYEDNLHCEDPDPVARLNHVLNHIGYCNALYGLMRTEAVRRTAQMGSFPGSDIPFHAEMALHGKIIEVPEHLFFRRMHEEASSSMTPEQREAFYRPTSRRAVKAVVWRNFGVLFGATVRAPLPFQTRLRLAGHLLRRMAWVRDSLWRELRFAFPDTRDRR